MKVNVRKRTNKDKKDVWEYYFNYKGTRYSKSGFSSKRKAETEGTKVMVDLVARNASGSAKGNMSLRALCDEYFATERMRLSIQTIERYQYSMSRVDDDFLELPINKLNYQVVQSYFNKHIEDPRGMVENTRSALKSIMRYAVRLQYVGFNPVEDVVIKPRKPKNPRTFITEEQFQMVLDSINCSSCKMNPFKKKSMTILVKLGYYLGLRKGEALSLTKSDFDLENQIVDINKTIVSWNRGKDDIYVKEGAKTTSSNSVLNIPDILIPDLREWFKINPYEIVCCDPDGRYMNPSVINNFFIDKSKKVYGFKFNYHMLRHSFAQNLVTHGVDPKTTQELMRHTKFSTTMNYYVHTTDSKKRDTLNLIFSSKCA